MIPSIFITKGKTTEKKGIFREVYKVEFGSIVKNYKYSL